MVFTTADLLRLVSKSPRCIRGDIFEGWRIEEEPPCPAGEFATPVFEGSGVVGGYARSAAEGRASEDRFREACMRCLPSERYPYVRTTTLKEDVKQHVDVEVSVLAHPEDEESCARKMCKVDVKAPKRSSRGEGFSDTVMWVEMRARNGNPGWIYGAADIIAQEVDRRGFVLLDRKALKDFAELEVARNPAARHTRRENPLEVVLKLDFARCVEKAGIGFWK